KAALRWHSLIEWYGRSAVIARATSEPALTHAPPPRTSDSQYLADQPYGPTRPDERRSRATARDSSRRGMYEVRNDGSVSGLGSRARSSESRWVGQALRRPWSCTAPAKLTDSRQG